MKPILNEGDGTVGGGRKLHYRGVARCQLLAELTAAAYNLVRIAKLTLTHRDEPARASAPADGPRTPCALQAR